MRFRPLHIIFLLILFLIPQGLSAGFIKSDIPSSDDQKKALSKSEKAEEIVTGYLKSVFAPADITVVPTPVTCFGSTDGGAVVTEIFGGTPPYTFRWRYEDLSLIPGETDSIITGLAPGKYYAEVLDAAGPQVKRKPFTISEPFDIAIFDVYTTDVTCNGFDDGTIIIDADGGTGSKHYSINNGVDYQDSETFTALSPGSYNIVVMDDNGCTKNYSGNPVIINEPFALSRTLDALNHVTCNGVDDGSIYITVTGGTSPYNYAWTGPGTFASTDKDILNLAPGEYDLTVIDDNGCSENFGPDTITEPTALVINLVGITPVTCNGGTNGAIDIAPGGGTPPYSFSWSHGPTDEDVAGLSAASYTITLRDANNCTLDSTFSVIEPTPIKIDRVITDISCKGGSDGAIDITPSGSTPGYTFSWSTGATTEDISGLSIGGYTVTVYDANLCPQDSTFTISEPPALTIAHSETHVSCYGLSDGSIDITPGGGTPGYTFSWLHGPVTEDVSGLSAGFYTIRVTDSKGCFADSTIEITQPLLITITHTETHVSCKGGNDGSIDITPSGGTTAYSFSWSHGPTTEDVSGLSAGPYKITVTDAHSCTADSTINITEPLNAISIAHSETPVTCNGGNDGSIDITPAGGTPGYTYSWDHGPTTQDVSGLSAGPYTVTVTDTKGCKQDSTFSVGEPTPIKIDRVITDVSCKGGSDGAIVITPSGSNSPYTFSWSTGATTQNISGLSIGDYTVTVYDDNSCEQDSTFTISEPPALTIAHSEIHVSCNGLSDGSIDITPGGGTPVYSFSWSHGPTTEDVSGLSAGFYTITVTDFKGCFADSTIEITEPLLITIAHTETHVSCKGGNNGSINITPSGGTSGYTYAWSHGPTTKDVSGLVAGPYTITVTDAHSCTTDSTINITEPANAISIAHSEIPVTCNGGNDGSIDITPAGGTPGYTYSWDHGPTTQNVFGLSAGLYKVTVTDTKGCKQDSTFSVSEPTPIQIDRVITDVSCKGGSDGAIDIFPSGSTSPYTFSWSTGATTQNISGLSIGDYTVTVYDDNSCEQDSTFTISEPPALTIAHSEIHVSCNGLSDGSIDITPGGGTSGYTFAWSHGPITEDVSVLSAGFYTITVTDSKGCNADSTIEITEPFLITITHTETHVSCKDGNDGSIDITPSGGTTPYTFAWDHGPTTEDVSGLSAGPYTITVTDAHSCTADSTINITEPANAISIGHTETPVKCNGGNDGSIDITPAGGTPGYSYSWDHGPTTQDVSGLSTGLYKVTVTDTKGCTQDSTFSVSEPTPIQIDRVITDVSCKGGSNGAIDIFPSGSTSPYTFSWSTGAITQNISGLSIGDYTVTVYDDNSCEQDSTFTISEPPALTIAHSETHVSCNGLSDGSIYITPGGGTPGYSFSWLHGPTTEDVLGLSAGSYKITITDTLGCTADSTINITEPLLITIAHTETHVSCKGGNDGSINITPSGGTSGYTYAWSHGPTTKDVSGLVAGPYTITVKDAHGCTADSTINITEPANAISIVHSETPVTCNGGNDGSIDITPAGGTPGYTYFWDHGPITQDVSGLSAGSYKVTVTDTKGCIQDSTINITEPLILQVSLTKTDIACNKDANGIITAHATGGTSPYEYSKGSLLGPWKTDSVFSNLTPNIYRIYVHDVNLCITSDTISIKEPVVLEILSGSWDYSNNKCFGDSNAYISITATGGVVPLMYSIDSGYTYFTSSYFGNLPAGEYYPFVKDQNGCTDEGNKLVLKHPDEILIVNYGQIDITSCSYSKEGYIAIEASGGITPITYTLDGSESTMSGEFFNVGAGPHLIEIIDANSCQKDTTVVINSPPPILVDAAILTHIAGCYGDSTGSIDLTASGGTGILEYAFDGGPFQATASYTDLPAGSYTVTIKDENDCTLDTILIINQPDTIVTSSISVIPVTCKGDTDGSITVAGSGGTAPYSYTLTPGSVNNVTGVFDNLAPGIYTVTIDDANGCPSYTTPDILVDEPEQLLIDSVTQVEITCFGMDDGQINIYGSGGYTPFNYSVNNGTDYDTTSIFTGLAPSTYYIIIRDLGGCMVQGDTLSLSEPPKITIDTEMATDVSTCYGDSTGLVSVSASGGRGPITYSIDLITWQVSGDFGNLPVGDYSVIASDTAGCSAKSNVLTISQPEMITADITMIQSINGEPGSLHVSASGGTGNLDYSISGPAGTYQADTAFLNLWPGDYPVVVRDENGCMYQETVTLDAVPLLEIDVSYSLIDCYGQNSGTITLISINGTGTVQYSIDGGTTFYTDGNFTYLPAATYPIYATDEDHRIFKDTVIITEPPVLSVISTVTNATCNHNTNDGSIILSVSGGTPAYSYQWSNDSISKDLLNLDEGSYSVTITDAQNCTLQDTFIVVANVSITADAGNDTSVCPGTQIILNGSGGTSYFWQPDTRLSNSIIANPVATITADITYVLTVAEPGGCYDRDSVTIGVYPLLGIDAGNDTTVAVGQTIRLNASGGPFETYSWNPQTGLDDPASSVPSLLVSEDIIFHVTGISIYGCSESDSVTITTAGNLIIYNGFTPNGDGVNDFWDIDNVGFYPNITVEVYNRWGAQVFSSKGYGNGKRWNGKYRGKDVAIGTYYYIINLNDGSKPISGHVTIVR